MNPWDLLTGDAEKDRRNVAILMESVEDLYGPRDLQSLLVQSVDRAIRVTGAQRGLLLMADGSGGLTARVARSAQGTDLPLSTRHSRSVVAKVWASSTPHLTIDAEDHGNAALGQSIMDLKLLSIMAVPLPHKTKNLGVLYVDSMVRAKEFKKADFAVLKALGGIVALAVEAAASAQAEEERRKLKAQMSLARTIQQALLPKNVQAPPGYDLAAEGRPCEDTSGDYYDAIPLTGGRMGLVVGDVSGHGLGQALIMAATRAQVHALLRLEPSLVDVMHALNGFLVRDLPGGSFMSLFLGVLDPPSRTLTYVSAGHNPPLLARADGTLSELMRTGPVLGVLNDAVFTQAATVQLAPGDALVLYTDGLFEAHGPQAADAPQDEGELYGEERMWASLLRRNASARSAQEVLAGLLGDLAAFVGARPLDDDLTCLVLRVL